MAIVGRHVETHGPFGLPPNVLNVPHNQVGLYKASASSGVFSTAAYLTSGVNNDNRSVAPGTQVDYARNLCVLLSPNTASAGFYSGGSVIVYGRDVLGSTRSEAWALTALNTVTAPIHGSINFASIASLSFKSVKFHTASSSARSDVSVYVGVGSKIGLPINLKSSDAIYRVHIGSLQLLTSSGASSSNNQYTVSTGDYFYNGVICSNLNVASVAQIGYLDLGFRGSVTPA